MYIFLRKVGLKRALDSSEVLNVATCCYRTHNLMEQHSNLPPPATTLPQRKGTLNKESRSTNSMFSIYRIIDPLMVKLNI